MNHIVQRYRVIVEALFCLMLFFLVSCRGVDSDWPEYDSSFLVLSSDRVTADPIYGDTVLFAVHYKGVDVMKLSKITNVTDPLHPTSLYGNSFKTDVEGTYSFKASYNGFNSNLLQVTYQQQSNFYKKVCVFYFTGSWCVYCPQMVAAIKTVSSDYPNVLVPVAIHCIDEYSLGNENVFTSKFGISTYPQAIIDFIPSACNQNVTVLKNKIANSINNYPALCNISGKASLSNGRKIVLNADVLFKESGSYKIWIVLLENGIVGSHAGQAGDYIYDNVVRGYFTSVDGDEIVPITKSGSSPASNVYSDVYGRFVGNYSFICDSKVNISNCKVAVAVMRSYDGLFYINNINLIDIDN